MKKKEHKRRRVVHVEMTKESKSYDGYLKYILTLEEIDGKKHKVPAYGRDLQDALSRVVHDARVETVEKAVIKKIPEVGWILSWFLGLSLFTICTLELDFVEHDQKGIVFIGGFIIYAFFTLSIYNWFNLRNRIPRK